MALHYLTPDCDTIPNVRVKGLRSTVPHLEAVKAETESCTQGERGDRKNERTHQRRRGERKA
ncbi:Lipoprotein-releasing system ATP-binding protein LolD [Clarias magur]|uniref:Lipoprotein-releasing system ATP-binding protein LolD n=1 Tax=Clarias magur TaxID=1594786 RepID=A0A8J4X2Q3_CLAMG|nr:Lipoprotein-releasing system ATP-binding protein LolD [Clarias magur]